MLLLTILFYWKILLTDQFSILAQTESANQAFAWLNFWAGSVLRGELPIWDPYSKCGDSFIGAMQMGAMYPLHLLLLPLCRHAQLSPQAYQIWWAFVHFLGACLMYSLVRELGRGRLPAVVAGICFSFGGVVGANPAWPFLYESAIWLPAIFLFMLRALRTESSRHALLHAACAGSALGLSVLAGGLHVVIMQAIVVVSATAFAVFQRQGKLGPAAGRAWVRPALVAAVVAAVGLCAGAIQLLPSMEYSRLALRWIGAQAPDLTGQKIPYIYLGDGLSPGGLLGMLIMFAYNANLGGGEAVRFYLGVFPLLLAVVGVWKCWSQTWVRYLAGLWAAALVYALGTYSLLHGVLYAIVPYLWLAREATRFVYLADFALAILAAYGLQILLDGPHPASFWRPLNRIVGIIAAVAALALAAPAIYNQPVLNPWVALSLVLILVSYGLFRHIIGGHTGLSAKLLVVGLILFDLSAFDWSAYNKIYIATTGTNSVERLRGLDGVANYLKSRPGLFRVHLFSNENIGDMYRVQSTHGAGATALKDLVSLDVAGADSLLNVGYLVRPATASDPGPLYQDQNWKVYANPGACPRAWIVHEALAEPSAQRLIDRLLSPQFDPRRSALLSAPLDASLEPAADGARETASIHAYRSNEIQLSVHAASSGLLVLSEMYYPGWEATANGRELTIHKVDNALRGIVVPPGDSQVVLRYRPASVILGAALSLTAFLGTALMLLVEWYRRRNAR